MIQVPTKGTPGRVKNLLFAWNSVGTPKVRLSRPPLQESSVQCAFFLLVYSGTPAPQLKFGHKDYISNNNSGRANTMLLQVLRNSLEFKLGHAHSRPQLRSREIIDS